MNLIGTAWNGTDPNATIIYGTVWDFSFKNGTEQARAQWEGQDTMGY